MKIKKSTNIWRINIRKDKLLDRLKNDFRRSQSTGNSEFFISICTLKNSSGCFWFSAGGHELNKLQRLLSQDGGNEVSTRSLLILLEITLNAALFTV